MSNYKLLNLFDTSECSEFYRKLKNEKLDIYFTPEYYQIYEELGDGKAQCFVFEKDGYVAIYPFLLNSVNKLGYTLDDEYYDIQGAYGYNGVIANNNSIEFRNAFYLAFNNFCKDANIIAEFTRFHPILKNYKFSEGFLNVILDRITVVLDLSKTYEEIWSDEYSSKNRNMIRKAGKKDIFISINEYPSLENIKSFVVLYQSAMNEINAEKYYLFNERFFFNTFNKLGSKAVLLNVSNNNKIECSSLIILYGNYAHYHLSGRIKGSDNSVNNYILDEAVKYAKKKGAKFFHFGGGTTSNDDDPLLKFKSNFSKSRSKFFIGKKIHNYRIYNEVLESWKTQFPEKAKEYPNTLLRYRLT